MDYLWAFLIFAGIWALTTMLTGFLGLLIPIIYLLLGFILGTESIILGLGGLFGSLLNIYNTNKYIRTQGAMSHAPIYSKIASIGYIIVFISTIIAKYAFSYELTNINYWYLFLFAFIAWIILSFAIKNRRTQTLDNFYESVLRYKIVDKYEDDPKWATYLYFNNGEEGWNQTISGSFLAKHPENDLTFAHSTKEDALRYAQSNFKNAEYIDE